MKMLFLVLSLMLASFVVEAQQPRPQCKGLTQQGKGPQCRNKAAEGEIYCRMHNPKTPRCGSTTTKTGKPCQRTVSTAGQRCSQHAGK